MPQAGDLQQIGTIALIALGANLPSRLGPPAVTLSHALDAMPAEGVSLLRASRFYATPCFPPGAGPDYVNAAAMVATARDAPALMAHLHGIETRLGRVRGARWGMRALDLDLIAHGAQVLPDAATFAAWRDLPAAEQLRRTPDRLILPHPRMQDRRFVLVPLAEIAPDWCHPVSGESIAAMCAALGPRARAQIRPL